MRTEVSSGRSTEPPRPRETRRAKRFLTEQQGALGALLQSSGTSSPLDGTLGSPGVAQSVRHLAEAHCKESNRLVRTRMLSWCGRGPEATRAPIPILGSSRLRRVAAIAVRPSDHPTKAGERCQSESPLPRKIKGLATTPPARGGGEPAMATPRRSLSPSSDVSAPETRRSTRAATTQLVCVERCSRQRFAVGRDLRRVRRQPSVMGTSLHPDEPGGGGEARPGPQDLVLNMAPR